MLKVAWNLGGCTGAIEGHRVAKAPNRRSNSWRTTRTHCAEIRISGIPNLAALGQQPLETRQANNSSVDGFFMRLRFADVGTVDTAHSKHSFAWHPKGARTLSCKAFTLSSTALASTNFCALYNSSARSSPIRWTVSKASAKVPPLSLSPFSWTNAPVVSASKQPFIQVNLKFSTPAPSQMRRRYFFVLFASAQDWIITDG